MPHQANQQDKVIAPADRLEGSEPTQGREINVEDDAKMLDKLRDIGDHAGERDVIDSLREEK